MENDAERIIWAVWLMLMSLVSFFGDTTILIASIKYRAFKLNKVIVIFIEHIAVCDLFMSFFSILTQSISLLAKGWIFGALFCEIEVYINFHNVTASRLLVCGMTVCKLWMLKCPLRAKFLTRKHAHTACLTLWVLAGCVPGVFLIVDKDDIAISKNQYTCSFQSSSQIWKKLRPVVTSLFVAVPLTIVIVSSLLLVKHLLHAGRMARRIRSKVPRQGIVTVVLTSVIYCISFFPKAVHETIRPYVNNAVYKETAPRVVETATYLNVVANFFLYSLTVSSFRNFLKTKMGLARELNGETTGKGKTTTSDENQATSEVTQQTLA
ncbi:hypothetical protein ACHWQZ_G005758 [Mnemiopsis leidyi]